MYVCILCDAYLRITVHPPLVFMKSFFILFWHDYVFLVVYGPSKMLELPLRRGRICHRMGSCLCDLWRWARKSLFGVLVACTCWDCYCDAGISMLMNCVYCWWEEVVVVRLCVSAPSFWLRVEKGKAGGTVENELAGSRCEWERWEMRKVRSNSLTTWWDERI